MRGDVRRPAVNSESVIDAALTLFARQGYHGTTVGDISELLGVRSPSLYNHMRSKQELLRTIVDRTTAEVLRDFEAATNALLDPADRLRAAAYVYAYRHATHRREALVVNRDTASVNDPEGTRLLDRRRQHERALRRIITDGVETRIFEVDSPALASFAINEMCVSIARWFSDDGPLTSHQVATQYAGFALRIAGHHNQGSR